MSILIESPTAESIWQAVQQLPAEEIERLKQLMSASRESAAEEETVWREASSQAAHRFFEEEESA